MRAYSYRRRKSNNGRSSSRRTRQKIRKGGAGSKRKGQGLPMILEGSAAGGGPKARWSAVPIRDNKPQEPLPDMKGASPDDKDILEYLHATGRVNIRAISVRKSNSTASKKRSRSRSSSSSGSGSSARKKKRRPREVSLKSIKSLDRIAKDAAHIKLKPLSSKL